MGWGREGWDGEETVRKMIQTSLYNSFPRKCGEELVGREGGGEEGEEGEEGREEGREERGGEGRRG